MARPIHKLSARGVATSTKTGLYSDGGGLYLQVSRSGSKSWIYRFMMNRKVRDMGLGSVLDFTLAEAREKARDCRRLVHEGIDPIEERNERRHNNVARQNSSRTFKDCAEEYLRVHSPAWKNKKHIQQWENTLTTYAYPRLGKLPVQKITTEHVTAALLPIWTVKTETATRLRGRIERILDWATVQSLLEGANPARWKGHLDNVLPAPNKLKKVKHFSALPYADLPDFLRKLQTQQSVSAAALTFLILTASRSGEVRLAIWSEIDLAKRVWTIPADRMKAGREHTIPLCNEAIQIIERMQPLHQSPYVFSGISPGRPMSDMTLTKCLRRMEYPDITVHGFRSSFRDWAGETTNFGRDVIEAALAHQLKDKTEAAYYRSNLLDKRRLLMRAWEQFCFP